MSSTWPAPVHEALLLWPRLLGQSFEIAVKRGVLHHLRATGLLTSLAQYPQLESWTTLRIQDLCRAVHQASGATDHAVIEKQRDTIQHLCVLGMGLGQTVMRAWLSTRASRQREGPARQRPNSPEPSSIRGLWCPLELPGAVSLSSDERVAAFAEAMGPRGHISAEMAGRGFPPQADFLLWWQSEMQTRPTLLCLEFSLNASFLLQDFQEPSAHLDELIRHISLIQQRGVFSQIHTEVEEAPFALNMKMLSHLDALTSRDKPLYKLCQGASYATTWADAWFQSARVKKEVADMPVAEEPAAYRSDASMEVQVLAVTSAGLEGLYASLAESDFGIGWRDARETVTADPRSALIMGLGRVYREAQSAEPKLREEDSLPQITPSAHEQLLERFLAACPPGLASGLSELLGQEPGHASLSCRVKEPLEGFLNPVETLSLEQIEGWLTNCQQGGVSVSEAEEHHNETPRSCHAHAILERLEQKSKAQGPSLRDLHFAAVHHAMLSAPRGELTVLGLEGHPGIGKTYAATRSLGDVDDGFLFFYVSPRVVINNQVTDEMAACYPNALTLTTNAIVNQGASRWYYHHKKRYGSDLERVEGAVVCQVPPDFRRPTSPLLFLQPTDQEEINDEFATRGFRRRRINEHSQLIEKKGGAGVLQTLGRACRLATANNPFLRQVVLTGSIQGYRQTEGSRDTVESFGRQLFVHRPFTERGLRERQRLAQQLPTVVVMIDELAGDGAGPYAVHAFAKMLYAQFLDPFVQMGLPSPFRVVLVLADASLGNEVVMEQFLRAPEDAPPRILVAQGKPGVPFRIVESPLTLHHREVQAFHIMADAFPARKLSLELQLDLEAVQLERRKDGLVETPRQAADRVYETAVLVQELKELFQALVQTPASEQVIFFAQSKRRLREIEALLFDDEGLSELDLLEMRPQNLEREHVAKLDSSVSAWKRRALTSPGTREQKRLFLMTSSGARGVSFPRATTIIARMPRFSIETNLMEIIQLIFRGRGGDGDRLNRRLVMLIQDFFVAGSLLDAVETDETELLDHAEPPYDEASQTAHVSTEGVEEAEPPNPLEVWMAREGRARWIRQVMDLATLCLVLRSSIMTRIVGDAGLPHQALAIVPVGQISHAAQFQTMAQVVLDFLEEAEYAMDLFDDERMVLLQEAIQSVPRLFEKSRWDGVFEQENAISPTLTKSWRSFLRTISNSQTPLLSWTHPIAWPAHLYVDGVLCYEDWSQAQVHEHLEFELWDPRLSQTMASFRRILGQIVVPQSPYPLGLKRAARDMLSLLRQEEQSKPVAQHSKKRIDRSQIWIAMPLDYPRFYPDPGRLVEQGKQWRLEEPDVWHRALLAAAHLHQTPLSYQPIFPRFADLPHLASVRMRPPFDLDRILDPRRFAATRELNLLALLLLHEERGSRRTGIDLGPCSR